MKDNGKLAVMDPVALLTRWGLLLVFGSVLLEHGGLPLPAAPILVAAGALAEEGALRPEQLFGAALLACLVADHVWFLTGRRYGRRLLAGVCRLSLSPDTCVRKTDDLISRHGAPLLLVAKFIPGVSAVAIPTAAAMGLPYRRFLLFDTLGSLLWSGVYVGAGMIFSREVNRVIDAMGQAGGWSLLIVLSLFALYVGLKFAHRWRLRNLYRLVRISPAEMSALIEGGHDLLVLDARSGLARQADPRLLPHSIAADQDDILELLPHDARDKTIITFCTCPNEASAAPRRSPDPVGVLARASAVGRDRSIGGVDDHAVGIGKNWGGIGYRPRRRVGDTRNQRGQSASLPLPVASPRLETT